MIELKISNGTPHQGSKIETSGRVITLFAIEGKQKVIVFAYCMKDGESMVRNMAGGKQVYEVN